MLGLGLIEGVLQRRLLPWMRVWARAATGPLQRGNGNESMVQRGLEPLTLGLLDPRSNQLSY